MFKHNQQLKSEQHNLGRFPANIILDEEAGRMLGEPSRFFYCAKASKSERNDGMEELELKQMYKQDNSAQSLEIFGTTDGGRQPRKNNHPTVKPIKLMEYLIKLTTKENAIVLDPFIEGFETRQFLVMSSEEGTGLPGLLSNQILCY